VLIHPTLEKLSALELGGMARVLTEQLQMRDMDGLGFEERLGLLVDREMTGRHNRKLRIRLKKAHLQQNAVLEDIDYRQPRGLDKSMILGMASCRWVEEHHNVLITGPTGVGKSYLACALAHTACREGYRTIYYRMPRLLQEMAVARVDGRYGKILVQLLKQDILVIDDWGTGAAGRSWSSGPSGNPGGSPRPPFNDRLEPTAGPGLARNDRGSDAGRRHLGPARPPCLPTQSERRIDAENDKILDAIRPLRYKVYARRRFAPTPGWLPLEQVAEIIGIRIRRRWNVSITVFTMHHAKAGE